VGVSRAAVPKVLRNAYGLSDDMRRKFEAAMGALSYRPQTAARGLLGSTYTLGVLMPDIRNPFYPDILDGIVDALDGTHYQPLLGVRLSADRSESMLIDTMTYHKLNGFIMIAPLLSHAYLSGIAKQFRPSLSAAMTVTAGSTPSTMTTRRAPCDRPSFCQP
jgi:LacI family transcriptional regulator